MFACPKVEEHWPNLRNFFPLPMYRSDYCQVGDRLLELVVTSGVGVLTENLKFATSRKPWWASSLRSSLSDLLLMFALLLGFKPNSDLTWRAV